MSQPAPMALPTLTAFRLVNSAHVGVTPGTILPSSQASNMKLGAGIYFAESEGDALAFFKSHHGYEYTHFLECSLSSVTAGDFFDLAADENAFVKFKPGWVWEAGAQATGNAMEKQKAKGLAAYKAFAEAQGKKGIRWASRTGGWVELVYHEPHCVGTVTVVTATELAAWKAKHKLS